MKQTVSTDLGQLSTAQAWLAGGNCVKAMEELNRLGSALRNNPDVLETRHEIAVAMGDWRLCFELASELLETAPNRPSGWIMRSMALHRMNCTLEASRTLEIAVELFPRDWTVPYQLARFACLAGDLEKTWDWLALAFGIGEAKKIHAQILSDPDLKPFWPQLGQK